MTKDLPDHAPVPGSVPAPTVPSPPGDVSRRRRAGRGLLGALALVTAFIAGAVVPQSSVDAVGPIPSCDLGDVLTVPRDYGSWSVTLVDRLLRVEDDYVPPDLVPVTDAGIVGGGMIRAVVTEDLRAMTEAAAANGTPIGVWSPYRSYDEQVEIFTSYSNQFGFENAITYSQRPGHSEHQLGLAIDFMSAGGGNPLPGDWGATPAGAWMRENSWQYGWVNSYPLGEGGALWNDDACFHYEPWHYRYLGREIAAQVQESGLTIREYLWANFTMVDPVTGQPLETPTPSPSPSPTPSLTPTPTPSPSPTRSAWPASSPTTSDGAAAESPALAGEWLGLDPPVAITAAVLIGLLLVAGGVLAARRRGSSQP